MDLLEYPIEYHKPVDGEKLFLSVCVIGVCVVLALLWKRRGLPVSIRH